jgi:hypothetical protein
MALGGIIKGNHQRRGTGFPIVWALTAALAAMPVWLAGCFTDSGDEETLESVELSATGLIGDYRLVDFVYERGDGVRLDTSNLDVSGTLVISPDSVYRETIVIEAVTTPTLGRIARLRAVRGDKGKGELVLTLADADSSASGTSTYAFHRDTLTLVTEVSKERDAAKKGFRETAYYLREIRAVE